MRAHLLCILMPALMLGGCESYLPNQPRFASTILLPKGKPLDSPSGADVRTPTEYQSSIKTPVPHSCEIAETNNDQSILTKAQRNDCIDALMTDVDGAFQEYRIQLQSDMAKTNAALDLTSLGLSTIGTAVKGANAKTILAAIGTGVTGTRTAITQDFLYKATLQTLYLQMLADRSKIDARITKSETAGVEDYTLRRAYRDVLDYYYAGTLLGALQSNNADTGVKATQCANSATSALAQAQGGKGPASAPASDNPAACDTVSYTYDDAGKALEKIWYPDGVNVDAGNETKLNDCRTKLGIPSPLSVIVNFAPNDTDRNKLIGCFAGS